MRTYTWALNLCKKSHNDILPNMTPRKWQLFNKAISNINFSDEAKKAKFYIDLKEKGYAIYDMSVWGLSEVICGGYNKKKYGSIMAIRLR